MAWATLRGGYCRTRPQYPERGRKGEKGLKTYCLTGPSGPDERISIIPFWSAVQGFAVSLDEGEFGWEVCCLEVALESGPLCQGFVFVAEHGKMAHTIVAIDVDLELLVAVLSEADIHMHSVARSRGACVGMIRQSFCAGLSHGTRCAVGVCSLLQAK